MKSERKMNLPKPAKNSREDFDTFFDIEDESGVNGRTATDEVTGGINNRISRVFQRSLGALFNGNRNIYELFFCLTKKLNNFFSLSRSILIIHSERDESLKVIAMKGASNCHVGLALTLPEKDSLLYRVLNDKEIYTENYPDKFNGNFIERKLLLDDNPGSIAVCPVKYKNKIRGLICLTSPALYAFTLFKDGMLDSILERFGKSVKRETKRLRI